MLRAMRPAPSACGRTAAADFPRWLAQRRGRSICRAMPLPVRTASRLAALCVALGVAVPASAALRRLVVSGPSTVRVGQEVRFPTTGFKPNERLEVSLVPTINRGGNCCAIRVVKRARADEHGKAILHWRWPSYYFNGPERVKWTDGARADVIVLPANPAVAARGRKVVTV
ncbi:MAG: hypothetical protein QOG42_1812, partial [Solirubrobacteraceae bacterium]|nr:hypothetical protein [Solirubrobacteraceae bacterium]